jgi:hypothetical protein
MTARRRNDRIKRDFFVILGNQRRRKHPEGFPPPAAPAGEPDPEILKESPCVHCELFVKETSCPHVKRCSKIDEFQRVASVCSTLCKPQDIGSIV